MNIIDVTFQIKTICYRNKDDRYTIANCIVKDYDLDKLNNEIIIKGYFPNLFVGDVFKSLAVKLEEETRGYYLKLLDIPEIIIPENENALAEFISKRVRGLSKKKALEIIDKLGLQVLTLIKDDYTPLLDVPKITEKKAKSIRDQLLTHQEFERLALFIQSLSLPVKYAVKIYDLYGDDSLEVVKSNPYSICYSYSIPFKVADTIANFLKYKQNNPKRVLSAILSFLNNKSESNGDLCVNKEVLIKELNSYLEFTGVIKGNKITKEEIETELKSLLTTKSIAIENNSKNEEFIYTSFNNYTENNIITNLTKIMNSKIEPFCLKEHIDDYLDEYERKYYKLDDKQKNAVYMALMNKISILTGGPGTGKTATTNTIVQCIKHIKPYAKISLLAPTGRASQRITELTAMEASTIHRCLKLNPYSSKNDMEEINADFIIVDESSMIDAYIFNKLISAIAEETRVIFVGDVDQLPSVGAGLIFKDLIDSEKMPITKLTTIFRQAEESVIVTNAHKIINGLKTTDKSGVDISNKIGNNFKLWKTENPLKVRENILLSIDKLMSNYGYSFNQIYVLSSMRKDDLGTIELNKIIQEKYNPFSPSKSEYEIDAVNSFREGDRVIQNTNNYELAVFNGDIGIIESIYVIVEDGVEVYKMRVEYPQKSIIYSEKDFEELELAYAITIHKSQGSEFPAIIMPIHTVQNKMLYRNLVYTGVTRAKDMCILIGQEEALNYSIEQVNATIRISLLKEKIQRISLRK